MIKKIILVILVLVVIFLIFKNIDFVKQDTNINDESSTEFTASPQDFKSVKITSDSYITWYGENKIQVKSHTGTLKFKTNSSVLGFVPANEEGDMKIANGSLVVDMTSLAGAPDEPEMLVNHLRSADFFDVEAYPQASFTIGAIADGEVQGILTVKDSIQEGVTIPYTISKAENGYKIEGEVELNRTDWGVNTLSGSFFEDLGDSIVEDMIKVNFVIFTEEV